MAKFILGKKIGMSQLFGQDGKLTPVTLLSVGPCYILQQKTEEKDGYKAIQVGFEAVKKHKKSHRAYRYVKEDRFAEGLVGDKIDLSIFKEGDSVKISGISKGKGFQGAVKMWNFKGKFASHGVKHEHRTLGSIGCRWPQRVILGKKMPGRMGSERTSVKNLKIVKIEQESNVLAVKGAVPGRKGTLLEIRA
ncbi:50S ribosomal protein L3 [Patescibacteria group bacterium]|nr:50S ribosomal protein L3 [Patescibacteria group bacterium]